jgi:hypothetical protein
VKIPDNKARLQLCVDALAADAADFFAVEKGITSTEALRRFMATKTYELLFDENSLLYLESAGYVYDMLKDELAGNWDRWREE